MNKRKLVKVIGLICGLTQGSIAIASGSDNRTAMRGEGVSDPLASYRLQAKKGIPEAQYQLGLVYQLGKGVTPNPQEAFEWYLAAARQGLAEAQYVIGLMYADGTGTGSDPYEALEWLGKAALQGHSKAEFAYNYLLDADFATGC